MQTPPQGMRLCPTRIDSEPPLVAHTITQPMCRTRQRDRYHKCGTCAHGDARASEVAGVGRGPRVGGQPARKVVLERR